MVPLVVVTVLLTSQRPRHGRKGELHPTGLMLDLIGIFGKHCRVVESGDRVWRSLSSGERPGTGGEHNCGVGERPLTAGHRNFSVGAQPVTGGEQTCGVGERPVAAGHRNFNAGAQPVAGGERPVTTGSQPAGVKCGNFCREDGHLHDEG